MDLQFALVGGSVFARTGWVFQTFFRHEQVGFFKAMLGLNSGSVIGPKAFFLEGCGLDQKLYDEMEYVISDMNTFTPHLLRYVLSNHIDNHILNP